MTSPLYANKSYGLKGNVRVPGDKSISHRAILCGLLARGETTVNGLLEAQDVLHTVEAAKHLGATIYKDEQGTYHVHGVGVGTLLQPNQPLDFGNAGTGSRLTMGVVASHPIQVTFDGDASLRSRPMARVLEPLKKVGVRILQSQEGLKLPLALQGAKMPTPFEHTIEVPSAQVKSALIFAALNAPGISTIIEPVATRDHSEKMLTAFGAKLTSQKQTNGGNIIQVHGQHPLTPQSITVPSDPSSAAFPIVAALIVEGSDIIVENVMMNPLRTGLLHVLKSMGGQIDIITEREIGGEMIADLRVQHSNLKAVNVPASLAPSMIDEYPILAIAAACAQGHTVMNGLEELKVKESDRLKGILDILIAAGIEAQAKDNTLMVTGKNNIIGGFMAKTHMDHRLAMSALILGLVSEQRVSIDDASMIATSFPNFQELMTAIGAKISS